MISEARTKVVSWLKSPKSIAAKAGLGVAGIVVLSVPVVSAFAFNGGLAKNDVSQSNVASQESSEEPSSALQNAPESVNTSEQPDNNNGSTGGQVPTPPSNPVPPAPTPQPAPQPAVYTDTYPAELRDAPISSKFDQWGLDNRQSTSYTAWKVNEAFGNMPKWGMTGNGNASNWPSLAASASIATGSSPKVYSVGVMNNFTVWVEAINGDKIDVSFYNWGNNGAFGYWNDVPASQFSTYIYFGG